MPDHIWESLSNSLCVSKENFSPKHYHQTFISAPKAEQVDKSRGHPSHSHCFKLVSLSTLLGALIFELQFVLVGVISKSRSDFAEFESTTEVELPSLPGVIRGIFPSLGCYQIMVISSLILRQGESTVD